MAEKYIIGTEHKKGGWRNGGRPKGSKTPRTEIFYKKVTPEEKQFLTKVLEEYRQKNQP